MRRQALRQVGPLGENQLGSILAGIEALRELDFGFLQFKKACDGSLCGAQQGVTIRRGRTKEQRVEVLLHVPLRQQLQTRHLVARQRVDEPPGKEHEQTTKEARRFGWNEVRNPARVEHVPCRNPMEQGTEFACDEFDRRANQDGPTLSLIRRRKDVLGDRRTS